MKKFYLLAWILLAATILGAWQHDYLNPLTILAFSFIAFGLRLDAVGHHADARFQD